MSRVKGRGEMCLSKRMAITEAQDALVKACAAAGGTHGKITYNSWTIQVDGFTKYFCEASCEVVKKST